MCSGERVLPSSLVRRGGGRSGGAIPSAAAVAQLPPQVTPLPKCPDPNLLLRPLQISRILQLAAPRAHPPAPGPSCPSPRPRKSLVRPPPPAPAPSCQCRTGTRADTSASGAPGPPRSGSRRASASPRGAPASRLLSNRRDTNARGRAPLGRVLVPTGPRGPQTLLKPTTGDWWVSAGFSETLTQAGTTWVLSSDPSAALYSSQLYNGKTVHFPPQPGDCNL